MELDEGQAAYLDDLTIVEPMSNVTIQNNRLYLYEFTPADFNSVGTVESYSPVDVGRTQTTTLTIVRRDPTERFPQTFKCEIPDVLPTSTVYFDVDDTDLHWEGVISTDDENDLVLDENNNPIPNSDLSVEAQYSYLTGTATWTAHMPRIHRAWHFGTGAPYSRTRRTGRVVEVPPDEYTSETLAMALGAALNENAFAGSGEPSGSTYLVTHTGNKIQVRFGGRSNYQSRFFRNSP